MSRSLLKGIALAALIAAPAMGSAQAGPYHLGREATPNEIAAWNIDVRPDGKGLPEGHGTVSEGDQIFSERCAGCHGDFGEGVGRWPVLAGGKGTLKNDRPVKTIGSYWPYLSTVYDYIHRAMPFGNAESLKPNEVYAITAYLLYMNDVVTDDSFELSKENFTSIHLPNEKNFVFDPRPDIPLVKDGAPCMTNCKTDVKITMRAAVLNVTPDDGTKPKGDAGGSDASGAAASSGDQQSSADTGSADAGTKVAAATSETTAPAAPDPELVKQGEKVFRKCKACHMVGDNAKNRVGPELNGIVGRLAGSAEGFRYSKAMLAKKDEGMHWTEAHLESFLEKPKAFVPRTKMSFAGLKKPEDRAAVIAYLSQFKP